MAEVLDLETVYSRGSFERELRATLAELDRQQPQPGPPQEPVFPASWYSRPPMRNSAAIASYRESAGPPFPYGACSTARPSTVPSGRARGHAATGRGPRPLSSVSASALPPSADAGGSRANTPSLGRRASTPQSAEGGRVPTPQSAPGDRAPTPFSLVSLASVGAASAPNGGGGSGGGDQLPGSASVQHQYPAGSSATSKRPRQPTQQANSAQEFWRSAPTGPCSTETPSLAAVRGAFGPHRPAWPPVARRFAPIAPRWPAAAPRRKWPWVLILLARRTPRSRMRAADLSTSMHV